MKLTRREILLLALLYTIVSYYKFRHFSSSKYATMCLSEIDAYTVTKIGGLKMNQRKLVLYIASSLDGYIATEEHNLDWLFAVEGEDDNGYSAFYDTVDTVLIGRITYDWIMEHEGGDFPYKGKECYVFSKTQREDNEYVKFICDDVVQFTNDLKNKNGKRIWLVGGGNLLNTFINETLVDELIVTITPVLLGKGIPLFRNNSFQTYLSLKSINRFNQFVELHYEVVK